jgi:hypothetical protein
MGDLKDSRPTALDFERQGVRFVVHGAAGTRVVGPSARPEILERLRREIAWRFDAMVTRAVSGTAPVACANPPRCRTGACPCCGDAVRPYYGGHCGLCLVAIDRLRRARRP